MLDRIAANWLLPTAKNLLAFLSYAIIISMCHWTVTACVSALPAATSSTGTVIDVQGDTVWVLFEVVNRKEGDKASNYFHIPGHSYAEGDRYPDPYKDPELQKLLLTRAPSR